MASLRAEPCEAPTVRAQRLHRTLQDAISEEEGAAAELERAEAVLRRAAARAKASRTALAERLDELASRPLTVTVLEKTLIGVTVNALRKHATPAIAAKSERLVRGWKTLVEGSKTWGTLATGGAAPAGAASSSRAEALADRVLDEVRDEDGRVERRRAHPDSLEDALALREAREVAAAPAARPPPAAPPAAGSLRPPAATTGGADVGGADGRRRQRRGRRGRRRRPRRRARRGGSAGGGRAAARALPLDRRGEAQPRDCRRGRPREAGQAAAHGGGRPPQPCAAQEGGGRRRASGRAAAAGGRGGRAEAKRRAVQAQAAGAQGAAMSTLNKAPGERGVPSRPARESERGLGVEPGFWEEQERPGPTARRAVSGMIGPTAARHPVIWSVLWRAQALGALDSPLEHLESAVINLTPSGELRSAPSGPDARGRATGKRALRPPRSNP